ncbi:MAG TPA: Ig-like domain-containing protein [Gemmatimonadaceae bacterium]|jgi:Big-like domain-containing protein|nr:Ig-like domain-containing protein [Gemmatimonadaceae bacterium]
MRMQSIIALAAILAIAACDAATSPKLAGLSGPGGTSGGTNGGNNTTQQLVITPNLVQLKVGTTFQLSTNATAAQQSQIQWSSLAPAIVSVTQAGLVSAAGSGTATIVARFSFDTSNVATATIIASP